MRAGEQPERKTMSTDAKSPDDSGSVSSHCYMAGLDSLLTMFGDDFDWEKYWEDAYDGPDDEFRKLFKWHDYREGPRKVGTCDCGGHRFENTPEAFYRAAYLLKPSHIDMSDMYKTGSMIDFVSPCGEFHGSLQLYKYEVQLYFACAKEHLGGKGSAVVGGWADCDNGWHCTSDLGNKWFEVAVKALERKWDVYPGNNFVV